MDQMLLLKQMFNSLSKDEQYEFLNLLKPNKITVTNESTSLNELILKNNPSSLPDRPCCAHCKSIRIVKNGHIEGTQRYRCRDCNKTFVISNNTILFSTKKSLSIWQKYCECLINKFSLRKCAEICEISLETAFKWRHKILDALQKMQDKVTLKGIVEGDETFFALSFKGTKKENFSIPREAHTRGHSISTRGLSKDMVCVPCIVDHEGTAVGKISNLGKPKVQDLEKIIDNRIEEGSVFVTDALRGYQKVAVSNELTHVRIPRGKFKSGAFSIQIVNSYHAELKRMVDHVFKGVSTKYLNNYIVYHTFVNFSKDTHFNKVEQLKDSTFSLHCSIKTNNIRDREAIPV